MFHGNAKNVVSWFVIGPLEQGCSVQNGRFQALWKPDNDHSFESGVLEQGNIRTAGPEDQD